VLQAAAERLPFGNGVFDAALAQLVVHFMSDPVAGRWRVTRSDGVVACVWDHAGDRSVTSSGGRHAARPRRRG
jgi:hypothetical protein